MRQEARHFVLLGASSFFTKAKEHKQVRLGGELFVFVLDNGIN